ncbi:hypothetical protein [Streptococcus iniae]|uniref:hypothetical protein n=1 Tax=Streptococcus iniae TaxID=1346 RepID=UPI002B313E34|nr:hypothetical protein QYR55_07495 [Streptococcus iniae]WNZ89545.1 hypothetical protein QYR57_07210 [Streptococcus iniae]WNZ91173.1 hypothetical protein QYR59_07500 [Streptococcus iniae]WNZ96853.1 hypothetical protein QYR56_05375 [Streptococcus iniae]
MQKNQFPLVADGEPIIEATKQMSLYENEDLITNIHGFYQDKDYDDVTRDFNFVDASQSSPSNVASRQHIIDEGRSYAEEARKRARADLKQKRQAYLAQDFNFNAKSKVHPKPHSSLKQESKKDLIKEDTSAQLNTKETTREQYKRSDNKWSGYSEKLQQDAYILAEIPKVYTEPSPTEQPQKSKNNYDFLKRSQIYNSQENRYHKEKTIAQELNLSRLDDVN